MSLNSLKQWSISLQKRKQQFATFTGLHIIVVNGPEIVPYTTSKPDRFQTLTAFVNNQYIEQIANFLQKKMDIAFLKYQNELIWKKMTCTIPHQSLAYQPEYRRLNDWFIRRKKANAGNTGAATASGNATGNNTSVSSISLFTSYKPVIKSYIFLLIS